MAVQHDVYTVDASLQYAVMAYILGALFVGGIIGFLIGRKVTKK